MHALQTKDDQDLMAAVRYIRRVELQAPPLVAFNDEVTPPLELPALQPGQKHLEPRSLTSSASAAAAVCIVGGWQRSNKVLLPCLQYVIAVCSVVVCCVHSIHCDRSRTQQLSVTAFALLC
jgi:hypothetical protein